MSSYPIFLSNAPKTHDVTPETVKLYKKTPITKFHTVRNYALLPSEEETVESMELQVLVHLVPTCDKACVSFSFFFFLARET